MARPETDTGGRLPAAARRARRSAEHGLEMMQIALYAAAAVLIMGILIAAIALFVRSETNNIQPPANGGAGAIVVSAQNVARL